MDAGLPPFSRDSGLARGLLYSVSCTCSDWIGKMTKSAESTPIAPEYKISAGMVLFGAVVVTMSFHLMFSVLGLLGYWQAMLAEFDLYDLEEIPLVFAALAAYAAALFYREVRIKRRLNTHLRAEILQRRMAEDDLRVALAARDGFFAAMSHDLKTPVNSIMGFSDMMRSNIFGRLGNTKYEEYVEDIHRAACLLDLTISQILDVSKIRSDGALPVREEDFDLCEEIRFCEHLVVGWNGAHRDIVIDCGDVHPVISFDRLLFRRFMINLLSNAVKYAGRDAEIGVMLRPEIRGGGLSLTVHDNGSGVDASRLAEATEPFKRLAKAEGPYMDGAGLGLWIVRKIAEAHDCPLTITSAKGAGFTVTMKIPGARVVSGGRLEYSAA